MKTLPISEFGDPILRHEARQLSSSEVTSDKIQALIQDIRHTLTSKKMGIGLAAPQVGENLALSVIAVRPTEHRPTVENFDLVIINPTITQTHGSKEQMWEGCISSGSGEANLFAKVPRYQEVTVAYMDEKGNEQTETFKGLVAQVIQHEVDHLDGKLFVDRVTDTSTYMTMAEYKKQIKQEPPRSS